MSDSKTTIEGIPGDTNTIIDVKISGAFYARLQQLLLHFSQQKSLDEFAKELAVIKQGNPNTTFGYHWETIFTLVTSVETAAREQGKMKTQEINPT